MPGVARLVPMSVSAAPTPAAAAPIDARPAPGFGGTDVLLILMAALWGANFFAVQYGAAHMAPLAFNVARMVLGATVLLALALAVVRDPWPSWPDTLRLLACGVLGNGIYQIFFIEGVSRARGGSASLILSSSPAVLAIIGWRLRTETLNRYLLTGVVLSIVGVAMVMLGDHAAPTSPQSSLGNALLFAAMLTWAVYATLLRPLTHRVQGLHLTFITLVGGLVPLAALAARDIAATPWSSLSLRTFGAIAYSGLGALTLAYVIYYHGLKKIGATRTSMYSNLQPFVAILVAWQLQNDTPTLPQVAGFLCITVGLLLARKRA